MSSASSGPSVASEDPTSAAERLDYAFWISYYVLIIIAGFAFARKRIIESDGEIWRRRPSIDALLMVCFYVIAPLLWLVPLLLSCETLCSLRKGRLCDRCNEASYLHMDAEGLPWPVHCIVITIYVIASPKLMVPELRLFRQQDEPAHLSGASLGWFDFGDFGDNFIEEFRDQRMPMVGDSPVAGQWYFYGYTMLKATDPYMDALSVAIAYTSGYENAHLMLVVLVAGLLCQLLASAMLGPLVWSDTAADQSAQLSAGSAPPLPVPEQAPPMAVQTPPCAAPGQAPPMAAPAQDPPQVLGVPADALDQHQVVTTMLGVANAPAPVPRGGPLQGAPPADTFQAGLAPVPRGMHMSPGAGDHKGDIRDPFPGSPLRPDDAQPAVDPYGLRVSPAVTPTATPRAADSAEPSSAPPQGTSRRQEPTFLMAVISMWTHSQKPKKFRFALDLVVLITENVPQLYMQLLMYFTFQQTSSQMVSIMQSLLLSAKAVVPLVHYACRPLRTR